LLDGLEGFYLKRSSGLRTPDFPLKPAELTVR
jgi:hypothetical protein